MDLIKYFYMIIIEIHMILNYINKIVIQVIILNNVYIYNIINHIRYFNRYGNNFMIILFMYLG